MIRTRSIMAALCALLAASCAVGESPSPGIQTCATDTDCDDALFCNGAETCNQGVCAPGAAPIDDGLGCTVDACDEDTDTVSHVPDHGACDDGQFCNGAESCSAIAGCQAGIPLNVSDGVACTADSCDEDTDTIVHAPNDRMCSDAVFCNGAETCDATAGCVAGAPPQVDDGLDCTVDSCDEIFDRVVHAPSDAMCDDGLFCNGAESCNAGAGCVAGTPPTAYDGIDCTVETCDEATDTILHLPDDRRCDDTLFCNGAETCDAAIGCQAGAPPSTDDGIDCTADSCDEDTDTVAHAPQHSACSDGVLCNGQELCDAAVGCRPGGPPELCGDGFDNDADGDADCDDADCAQRASCQGGITGLFAAVGAGGEAGDLFEIDPVTAAATPIGPLPVGFTGLAFSPSGALFGAQSSQSTSSQLFAIDPETACTAALGTLSGSGDDHPALADLTFAGDRLIGWSMNGSDPVEIDPATGAVTVLGDGPANAFGSGLAADPSGTSVFAALAGPGGTLFSVDTSTGTATEHASLAGEAGLGIVALTFHDGELYGIQYNWADADLVVIDPATGGVTVIGPLPFGVDTLASAHPGPLLTTALPLSLPAWDLGAIRDRAAHAERTAALAQPPEADAGVADLCARGGASWLVVRRGDAQRLAIEGARALPDAAGEVVEPAALPGRITMASGRHRGQAALPLSALVESGVHAVRVTSCDGTALAFPAGDLDATGFALVRNRRGHLKLLAPAGAETAVALRRVALVELLYTP